MHNLTWKGHSVYVKYQKMPHLFCIKVYTSTKYDTSVKWYSVVCGLPRALFLLKHCTYVFIFFYNDNTQKLTVKQLYNTKILTSLAHLALP